MLGPSHSIRTTILSKLLEELGMTSKEDISEELKLHQVKQNCHHLEKIISSINDTMNPFASTIEKASFQYSQWESSTGWNSWLFKQSLNHWLQRTWLFHRRLQWWSKHPPEPIKQQKIKNVASEAGSYKVLSKNKSLVSLSMTRNLFGNILYHALWAEVDMEQILRYPLTPAPLPISHVGGTMQNTPMSKLLQELEKRVATNLPTNVDVTILDGMFFFHLLYQPPSTFAGLTDHLLRQGCKQRRTEIHLVFDKTISPSIYITLYKGCWKKEIKPARYVLSDHQTWAKASIKLASSAQRRSIQGSSCHIFSRLFGEQQFRQNLGFKEANCQQWWYLLFLYISRR